MKKTLITAALALASLGSFAQSSLDMELEFDIPKQCVLNSFVAGSVVIPTGSGGAVLSSFSTHLGGAPASFKWFTNYDGATLDYATSLRVFKDGVELSNANYLVSTWQVDFGRSNGSYKTYNSARNTNSIVEGKRLGDTELRQEYGVTVMAVQRGTKEWCNADADTVIEAGDTILIAGPIKKAEAFGQLR